MVAIKSTQRQAFWWLPLGLLLALACRKETPSSPPVLPAPSAPVTVEKDGNWLFTYATPEGRFETADKADDVPAVSRAVVRAQSPDNKSLREAGTDVWVVNLADMVERGRSDAKRVPRALFETQALALLPPGQSSILADRPADQDGGAEDPQTAASPGGVPRVVLYGTSWCGACRTARQYFLSHNIPFVDKDVEKDATAADELQKKAARLGVSADRVPILDVQGRLLIGFDPRRVEALLGETI